MSLIFSCPPSKYAKRDRSALATLGILAVLTGIVSTGCSSSKPDVIKSATETTETVAKVNKKEQDTESKADQLAAANTLSDAESVPVVSAADAGEDVYAVEDYAAEDYAQMPDTDGPTRDECNMRWTDACEALADVITYDDATAYVEKRQQALDAPTDAELTDHNGMVLPRVIPGLTVEMPYAEARQLILADGWQPAEGLDPEGNNNGLDDYAEVAQCSGTGMGLCIMSFTDSEMNRFSVTTWGSGPDVRDWTPVQ